MNNLVVVCNDFFLFKQKTAYDMRISDWSSDVCSSDLDLPIKTRAAHREFRRRPDLPVRLVLAGPLLADDAVTIIGSVIVVAADSRSQVEACSAADPYRHAGLVGSVRIELWNWTTGNPELEPAQ